MSYYKSIKHKLIFLGLSWGMVTIAVPPAIAQNTASPETNSNKVTANVASLTKPPEVSTKAQDLFLPGSNQQQYLIDVQQTTYQTRTLDLEKFCQNYPYNSKCSGEAPTGEQEGENSPTQIPVPQVDSSNPQSKSGWAIVPEVNTLGLGGHIVRKISPSFNARVGVNTFGTGIDINETEFDYEGDLNLFNVSTLIDVQPFKSSGFRLSAGLVFGNNNIQGTADVSERVADELGAVEFNGETIDIRDLNIDNLATIDADIDINNSVAPYLGIGGGNAVAEGKGLGFWWNLGVVFGVSPEATVTSNFSTEIPAELREEVVAAADRTLENEEADLNDELDVLGVYPVLSLGLSYQF
jgi:hypothetical protein